MTEENIHTEIFKICNIKKDYVELENYFCTNDINDVNEFIKEKIEKYHPLNNKESKNNSEEYKKIKKDYNELIQNYINFSQYLNLDKLIARKIRYAKKNNLDLNITNIWSEKEGLIWSETLDTIENFKNTLERQIMRNFTQKEQMDYFNELFNENFDKDNKDKNKNNDTSFMLTNNILSTIDNFTINNDFAIMSNKKYDIDENLKIQQNTNIKDNDSFQNNFLNNIQQNKNILSNDSLSQFFTPLTNMNILNQSQQLNQQFDQFQNQNLTFEQIIERRNNELNNIDINNNNYNVSENDSLNYYFDLKKN